MNQILLIGLLTAGFVACTNNKTGERTASVDLKEYVDSMNSTNLDYTQENWDMIDKGYQERATRAEAELANYSDAEKAELEASKKRYAELKAKYDAQLKVNSQPLPDAKVRLRNSLFGEGKVGDDMSFDFVTGENILSVYEAFVDAVDVNRNTYSREDWDEIKLLYEALDTRKNKVEPNLANAHNRRIAALKIKFASIIETNRPGKKVDENADAKK